jgi:transcriptional accessory protein Tex/SPT6
MKAINLCTVEELGIHQQQIAANISLLDRGATVPFVAC